MRIEKIAEKIWKITGWNTLSSNVYLIDYDVPTLIDLGAKECDSELVEGLRSIGYSPESIRRVVFTHLHFDHVGNPATFKNAKFFASREEIKDEEKNRAFFKKLRIEMPIFKINEIRSLPFAEIIKTPGHTRGSICIWMKKEGILFSGDTLFHSGFGRTDLPTSAPEKMIGSLKKLARLKYKLLCPGHG